MRRESGNLGEVLVGLEIPRVFVGERKAVAGKLDGRRNDFFERELAVLLLGIDQAGDRAGNANGFVSHDAEVLDDVAVGVEIHVFGGGGGSFFAEVDEVILPCRGAQQKESASAEVAGLRMDDGQGESGGDGGVNGIASGLHDFDSGARGQFVNAGDHGVGSMRRAQGSGGEDGGE